MISYIKKFLESHFAISALGPLKHYLGINVSYNLEKGEVVLSQENSVCNVVQKFGMTNWKGSSTQ